MYFFFLLCLLSSRNYHDPMPHSFSKDCSRLQRVHVYISISLHAVYRVVNLYKIPIWVLFACGSHVLLHHA